MKRVRRGAAVLSVLILALSASLYSIANLGADALACCIAAALCLAAIAPFEARRSIERDRVVAGCAVAVCGMAAAVALALHNGASPASMSTLIILLSSGLSLTAWSIRNRQRASRPAWANYFDR